MLVQKVQGDTALLLQRYTDRSADAEACWPWIGKLHKYGYGLISVGDQWRRAHRVSYELTVGPIPDDSDLDHTCHRPEDCPGGSLCPHRRCVNPAHLRPVTNAENHRADRISSLHRDKTHCPQGHEYTPENTKRIPSRPNARYCRECHRISERERYARRKNVK